MPPHIWQSFLFQYGKEMAGKNRGLNVSSASSGISGVEGDAKRLVPDGKFLSPSLWIRGSQTSGARSMLEEWLRDIKYSDLITGIGNATANHNDRFTVYSLSGIRLLADAESTAGLPAGVYIINGKKAVLP